MPLKVINKELVISKDDYEYQLKDKDKFVGHRGEANKPSAIIIKNNNLELQYKNILLLRQSVLTPCEVSLS